MVDRNCKTVNSLRKPMKKILFFLAFLLASLSIWAQEVKYDTYYNSHFNKDFEIMVFANNDTITKVWIEIGSENNERNYIVVNANILPHFTSMLELAQSEYCVELSDVKDIKSPRYLAYGLFPLVDVAWIRRDPLDLRGSYREKIALKLNFLDNGKITASWTQELPDSENPYILQRINFAFDSVDDFDYLINVLEELQRDN